MARLIYNYILEHCYDRTEDISSMVDLGGYDEYDQPSEIIVPTVVKVAEEANENADEYAALQEIAREEAVSESLGLNGEPQHTEANQPSNCPTSDENPDEGSTVIPSMLDTMADAEFRLENGIHVMVVKPSNDISQVLPLFHDQFYYPLGIKPELNEQNKGLVYAKSSFENGVHTANTAYLFTQEGLFSNQFVQCKLEPGSDLDPACKRAPSAGLLETFPVSREMGLPPYNPTVEGRKTRQRGFSQSQAWILTTPKL